MSTESNVFSQGGGGTVFEISIQTAYFISFLLGGQVPGLPDSHITYFRQQAGSLGYETDDVLMHCEDETTQRRLLFQVKHQVTITADNDTFKEVVTAAWKDFNNAALFTPASDRVYLVTASLPMKVKKHLLAVLSWAKSKATVIDFLNEVNRIAAKRAYYDIFKTIISATTSALTDEDLFRFFKCFEVLDYDLDQPASITRAGLLMQVGLAKETEHSALSICNEVFVLLADSNSKGGEYTLDTRPTSIMAKLKKAYLSNTQKTLLRLSARSQELLEAITDKIGAFHLNRTDLTDQATLRLATSPVLLVTGEAGAGKSALAKALVVQLQARGNGYVLAFKADELLTGQLRDWFDKQNITQDIKEIFAHFALLPNAVIYVDSMERLLEDEAMAFKQLLVALQRNPSIKLIGTCRKSLLSVINLKFFSSTTYVEQEVPYLSGLELDQICQAVRALIPAVRNTELQQLVRIPKYLDFAYRAIQVAGGDYSNITEVQFQEALWSAIVENIIDSDHHGLPMRRSESFVDIAVVRSRKMQQYVAPTNPDPEALDALQKETVLLQYQHKPLYAPAHDVLEDWALTRYTDKLFVASGGGPAFFAALGTEPSMRRAYRLWVAHALKEQDKGKIAFFTSSLTDTTLDPFWHIESLIAVLASPHCETFLQGNLALLKANDWTLLFQIIQIMRTASKVSGTYQNQKVFIPVGNGWAAIFKILFEDRASIPVKHHPTLLATLQEYKLAAFTSETLAVGTRHAGLLTQFFLGLFLAAPGRLSRRDDELKDFIYLLFAFAGGIPTELRAEFDRGPALAALDFTDENNDRLIRYGKVLPDLALKGPGTSQLARHLPDLVIALAQDQWYRKPRPALEGFEEQLAQMHERSDMDRTFRFGLSSHRHIEGTESALSTPIYWLLQYNTDLALNFVINLMDHATSHFRMHGKEVESVEDIPLTLPDGTTTMQAGSFSLWNLYRGQAGFGNPLLMSVLMALEKYLLDLGGAGDEETFQHVLEVLLTKSKTVATTAVASSAVMAYPHLAGPWVLPLLDQPSFYSWDISRYTQDLGNLFIIQDGSLDVKERIASHHLPHRKKFFAGLRGFVTHYWITVGTYNKEIAALIDRAMAAAAPADLQWKKTLEEIDGRRLTLGKEVEHEGKPAIEVHTDYSPEVQEMMDEQKVEQAKHEEQSAQVNQLKQAYEAKAGTSFEDWVKIYDQYKDITEFTVLRHAPGLLAATGVRDFWSQLNSEQRAWCIDRMESLATDFVLAGLTHNRIGLMNAMWDGSAVMETYASMLSMPALDLTPEQRSAIEETIFFAQVAYDEYNGTDYKKFIGALHQHFWPNYPQLATEMWYGALALGRKDGGFPDRRGFDTDEDYVQAVSRLLEDLFKKVRAGELCVDLKAIEFKEYHPWGLVRAINLIPDQDPPPDTRLFIGRAIATYLAKLIVPAGTRRDNLHEIEAPLQIKLARIFFESALGEGAALMEFFCKLAVSDAVVKAMQRDPENYNLYLFFYDTVKQTILEADQALTKDSVHNKTVAEKFQAAWKTLDKISTEINRVTYWTLLLLDIKWDEGHRHWPPIEGMESFFMKYLAEGTAIFPRSAINLLASIGDQTLLPDGLEILVGQLQGRDKASPITLYKNTKAEQLVHRLYDFHLEKIRQDPALMKAFRWLLDKLISEGSTDAYWINEFVISYHRKVQD
ncbi:MAG: ATP-binding protein [Puia sp.]|nr:ATP-binding protein [Puia sp.]